MKTNTNGIGMRRWFGAIALALWVGAAGLTAQGEIWIGHRETGTVWAYDPAGVLVTTNTAFTTIDSHTAVAVTGDGNIFLTGALANRVYHTNLAGSVSTSWAIGLHPHYISIDSTGMLWVSDYSRTSLYGMTQAGAVQATFVLPANGRDVAANAFSEIFVATETGHVCQFTTGGTLLRTLTTSQTTITATQEPAVAVDRNGDCWASYTTGNLIRWNRSTGQADIDVQMGTTGLANYLAVNGRGEVYVATHVPQSLRLYSSTGSMITSIALSYRPHGVSLDGNGDVWVYGDHVATGMFKYDGSTLNPLSSVSIASERVDPHNQGDATGYVQANIHHPNDDFDNDQVTNRAEIDAGSNPFDANSVPNNPRPILNGVPRPGASVTMTFRVPSDAGLCFAAGGSLGNNPANYIRVPNSSLVIPLENDAFAAFVRENFWHFGNFTGFLDQNGDAYGSINIPNSAALIGATFYFACMTMDDQRAFPVTKISNNVAVTVLP